ncbi:MAG: DUF4290 domain-containing protein [Prevotella sp.]|nr:DUF4290 domain-containing protein [Prevotella sp.]MBQ9651852.1 DUF4290 domain-containing protein [Prevotella sp.]
MNIQGMDYNTQRERLLMSEYGREIQQMVDYAIGLPTKEERQRCAEKIIETMAHMVQQQGGAKEELTQKLWDHLAFISRFQLDIDYPVDISNANSISTKPDPLGYPMKDIPVRHYGQMLFDMFEKLKTMPEGEERDELVRLTANQMNRNLQLWGQGSNNEEKVASDLARFTDGKIQLDIDTFVFDYTSDKQPSQGDTGKKRKRK